MENEPKEPVRALVSIEPRAAKCMVVALGRELRIFDRESKEAVEVVIENKQQEGDQQQENVIRTIAFSPCGKYFAAGGDDKCVALLSTNGWRQIHAFKSLKRISSVIFTKDGSYILAANKFGDVLVAPTIPSENGEFQSFTVLMGHFCSIITSISLSQGQDMLATSDRDGRVRITKFPDDPMEGAHEIQSYCFGHQNFVSQSTFVTAGDKEILMSGGGDGCMKIWEIEDGKQLDSCCLGEEAVLNIVPAIDKRSAVVVMNGSPMIHYFTFQDLQFSSQELKLNIPVITDSYVDCLGKFWFVGPVGQQGIVIACAEIQDGALVECEIQEDLQSITRQQEGDQAVSKGHLPSYLNRSMKKPIQFIKS